VKKPKTKHSKSKPGVTQMSDREIATALKRVKPEKYENSEAVPIKSPVQPVASATAKPPKDKTDDALVELLASANVRRSEPDAAYKLIRSAVGVKITELAWHLLNEAENLPRFIATNGTLEPCIFPLSFIQEMQPQSLTEGLLAVQMFGVHNSALVFLKRATAEGQTVEGAESCIRRAANLMRLFIQQTEAMAKLKGKTSEQKVTVEHVHVHQGGQAIVGTVSNGTPESRRGDEPKK